MIFELRQYRLKPGGFGGAQHLHRVFIMMPADFFQRVIDQHKF